MTPKIVPIACHYPGTFVQAYYIAAERPALIDTGGATHPTREIAAALGSEGTDLGAIEVIVNTHGHWDHAGGNAAVEAAGTPETWIHPLGAPLLGSTTPHVEGYATAQARLLFPIGAQESGGAFANLFVPAAPPTRLIDDGDRLDLGGIVLTVVHAPGHSGDSVALYWEAEGILIAADAAQGTGSRPGGCPLYFDSVIRARSSIRLLAELPFRELHVGHPFGRLSTPERTTRYDRAAGLAFLADSLEAIDLMEAVFSDTLAAGTDLSFPAQVAATVARMRVDERWPLVDDPALGVPTGSAVTFDTIQRERR